MRQIETQMINAIANHVNWKSANTRVLYSAVRGTSEVWLHGNLIAIVSLRGGIQVFDGGWQTTTTKSRLNALLSACCPGARVFAKRGEWFVNNGNETSEFESGMVLQWG